MTNTALSNVTLPVEKEVEAAVQGQRALAAFLATGFETQRIQIFDEKTRPTRSSYRPRRCVCSWISCPSCRTVMPSEWYRCMRN